jgi:hypothetical protein
MRIVVNSGLMQRTSIHLACIPVWADNGRTKGDNVKNVKRAHLQMFPQGLVYDYES